MKKYRPFWEGLKLCALGATLTFVLLVPVGFLFFIHLLEGWAAVAVFMVCLLMICIAAFGIREIGKQIRLQVGEV